MCEYFAVCVSSYAYKCVSNYCIYVSLCYYMCVRMPPSYYGTHIGVLIGTHIYVSYICMPPSYYGTNRCAYRHTYIVTYMYASFLLCISVLILDSISGLIRQSPCVICMSGLIHKSLCVICMSGLIRQSLCVICMSGLIHKSLCVICMSGLIRQSLCVTSHLTVQL
jgi:hypothetical protein